jgi:probable F420-dependent oxidoreductase
VPLALGAAWTKRATLGTAIVGAFSRGPGMIAAGAAAVAEAAPGRFILGIGAGSSVNVQNWNSVPYERPLKRVEEVVLAVRQALDGQQANLQGETIQVSGFRLGRPPAERVPIYIAALREKMLRLAGRTADGVIINWLSADDVQESLRPVHEEAANAGKDPGDFPVVCRLFVCVTDDADYAREQFRRQVTGYLNVPVYRKFQQWLGRGEELRRMNELWDTGDRKGALEAVPEEVISDLAVIGNARECREQIMRYYENGVTVATLAFNFMNPSRDPDAWGPAAVEGMRALAPPR